MAFYTAANHLIDNLGLDHLNSININIPVYCTGAGTAAPSSSSSSGLANSKASTSASTMHNHHTNQSQNVYPPSYYTSHPNANTSKASTSTSGAVSSTSWRDTSTGAGSSSSRGVNGASSSSGSGTTATMAGVNVTPLTPPMTSTFTSRTTPGAGSTSDPHYSQQHHHHQQQQPRLPSIAQLERGPETQPHYPRVSHRQYAYSNPSQHQSSGYQSHRQTYLVSQGYLQPQQHQQHQHLPPLTPPDDIPNHIPHREQASFSQSSPFRASSSSAAFARPHVEESDEEEEQAEEEDENMQVAEESESEEEEDVFMDASSSARTRRRDSPPSIAHETMPQSSSIYTSAPNGTLRAAPSTPPNYHPSYAPAPPLLSASPVDTYAPPPTTAAPSSSSHPSYPIDWLDFTRTRSAHFIAEKTCEMICYLWFSSPPADAVDNEDDSAMMKKGAGKEEVSLTSPMKSAFSSSNPPAKRPFSSTSPPSSLQLRTTPTFVSFMQKLLETTQVSQSVIVLSLHFIYRLKERNRFTPAQKGSEFRIGVAGLMMANKFLDDNTYTNKTWSEVSGIELEEINRMEREFLLGVDFNLYVDKPTYEAWLNLLKGLVWAKERDCRRVTSGVGRGRHQQQQHVRGRERERAADKPIAKKSYTTTGSTGPPSRVFTTPSAAAAATATTTTKQTGRTGNPYPHTYRPAPRVRARSSSPTARSSVQSQTSYSSRKDYWAPEQQQTYVYAPNNAAVAASTTYASNNEYAANSTPPSSMDLGAYTRVAQTTTTTSESRSAQASPSPAPPVFSYAPSANSYAQPSASAASSAYTHQQHSQSRPSSKRTADNAFSPTSTASFALAQPSKRPVSMGGLSMNMNVGSSGSHSTGASPLDGLQSFSRMSLGMGGSPSEGAHEREREREKERERVEREREAEAERERERERQKARPPPVTLSTAYSYDSHGRSPRVPQNLYFYTLACSPLKKDEVSSTSPASPSPSPFAQQPRYPPSHSQPEGNAQTLVYPRAGQRKARLRYHQPSLSSSSSTYEYADLNATVRPVYPPTSTTSAAKYDPQGYHIAQPQAQVQPQLPRLAMPSSTSAAMGSSTTRYLSAANANSGASTTTSTNAHTAALPHFRDDVWAMPPAPAYTCPPAPPAPKEGPIVYKQEDMEEVPYSDSTAEVYPSTSLTTTHNIPSAPFANAGPPGVSFSYYPEADANDSSSPSPATLRGNVTEATRLGNGNNIHRVGMMDDYLSSRRASASGVAGLSGYSSRGYPSASTMSYPEYRAGYSTTNPTSSATARSTSQNPPHAHVSGHGYTSGSYSTYASPVTYHSSTSALPASGGYPSGSGGYTSSSTTGSGATSGYPSGTYSAYASPHAGYGGGGVER